MKSTRFLFGACLAIVFLSGWTIIYLAFCGLDGVSGLPSESPKWFICCLMGYAASLSAAYLIDLQVENEKQGE